MPAAAPNTDRFLRRLARLEREVRHIATQPQLPYSSVEGGSIDWNSEEGLPTMSVGYQFDGSNAFVTFNGPIPPTPSVPTAEGTYFAATVNWDGFFDPIDAIVPLDFARVEIHAVDDPNDPADTALTLVGTYETPRGGSMVVPLAGPAYLKLVTRTTSGARSPASVPSDLVTPLDVTAVDTTAIQAELDELNNVTLPQLQTDLSNAELQIGVIGDTTIPAIQAQVDDTSAALATAQSDIDTLNTTTIPGIQTDLAGADSAISTLNTVTIPGINAAVASDHAAVKTLNDTTIPGINSAVATAQAGVDTLNNTTIPNINSAVATAQGQINTLNSTTIPGINSAIATAQGGVNTLNNTTIPGINSSIATERGRIDTLNNTTIPGINSTLSTANGNITALQGRFPIQTVDLAALAVTTAKIADAAILTAKLGAGSVTNTVIADDSVTSAKIVANTIVAADIAATTITAAQIAATTITGDRLVANTITAAQIAADTITAAQIAANAITTSELNALSVTAAKIVANTITAAQIAALTITGNEIAANAITAAKITADTITANELAANSVTVSELAANSVNASKIVALSITAAQIAATTITGDRLVANTITAAQIAADTITAAEIAANAVTVNELAANSVNASKIVALSITAAQIAANTITGDRLVANTITAAQIAADTITAAQIAANAITTSELAANSVDASKIVALSITAGQIAANTITGDRLVANTITAAQIAANTITAAQIAADTITATQIAASAITASELAAGAVTANKLLVTIGGGNLIPDSNFESTAQTTGLWIANGGTTLSKDAAQKWQGTQALKVVATTENWGYYSPDGNSGRPALVSGTTYSASVYVFSGTAQSLMLTQYGTSATNGPTVAVPANTWTRLFCTFVAPASNIFLSVRDPARTASVGTIWLDGFQLEIGDVATGYSPQPDEILPGTIVASMVSAGAITTASMTAGTINGDRITTNSLNADRIVANSITAAKIAALTITANEIAANTITATQIAATTITAAQIAANTITAGQLAANTITAAQIAAGTITGTQIAAGSITADRLIIGQGSEILANPGFESGSSAPHVYVGSASGSLTVATANVRSGGKAGLLVIGDTRVAGSYGTMIAFNGAFQSPAAGLPTKAGEILRGEVWVRDNSAAGSTWQAHIRFFDATGTLVSGGAVSGNAITVSPSYQRSSVVATAPAGTAYAQFFLNGANTTAGGTVLVDDASFARNLTNVGLQMYNAAGVQTVNIDAATGNATFQGEFGTSAAGTAGVHISSATFAGIYGQATYPTVQWDNGSQGVAGQRAPKIFTDTTGNSNLYMWGGASSATRMGQVKLDAGRARIGIENAAGSNEIDGSRIDITAGSVIVAGTIITMTGEVQVSGAIQMNGSIQTSASGFQFTGAGGGTWKEVNTGVLNVNGNINCTSSGSFANNLGMLGPTTGSFTANTNWNSASGNFRVNTSSRRYKDHIEAADIDLAKVLSLEPRSFERNDEKDENDEPVRTGHRYVGFIAEEAHDAGLGEWVVYDEEGPWSFAYDYWSVALQAVAKDHEARIAKQADEIAELKDQVAQLVALVTAR